MLAAIALSAVSLTACAGRTTGATDVTTTAATLNVRGSCGSGLSCTWYWEYWRADRPRSTSVKTAVQGPVRGPTPSVDLRARVTGLLPGITYRWVACGSPDGGASSACVGPEGRASPVTADPPGDHGTFTTAPLASTGGDRPDDFGGPQVHVVYAMPSDGIDRRRDVDGSIAASVAMFQRWLAGQTGGRSIRMDTYGGALDITHLTLPATAAELAAHGDGQLAELQELISRGRLPRPDKRYLMYYEGPRAGACGEASGTPDSAVLAALYLSGEDSGFDCASKTLAPTDGRPDFWEFAALHEIMHSIGFVASCATHHWPESPAHVRDSREDLMWGGDSWTPTSLDVGRDDYYRHANAGCRDLEASPYFGATSVAAPRARDAGTPDRPAGPFPHDALHP